MAYPWFANPFRRRITIAVDLVRLLPGGENGGVKPAVFALLDWMGRREGRKVRFIYVGNEATRSDFELLARPADLIWCSHLTTADPDPGDGPDKVDTKRLLKAEVDLLYCPFGPDRLGGGRIPFVSLLIDLLHREVPESLPDVEVAHRERFFADACDRAAMVQVISDDVSRRLVEAYALQRDRLFRTWLPLQEIDEPGLDDRGSVGVEGRYMIYPANLWPHKNHPCLLEAFARFLKGRGETGDRWSLVLTGTGPSPFEELNPRIEALGLTGRVHAMGFLDRADYLSMLRRASFLIFPSLNEGFGIPVLEAQKAGVAVTCSSQGSLPEVAGDGALFFDPRDPSSIAESMERLVEDRRLKEDLIRKGRSNLTRYSFRREAALFARVMRRAAG